MKYFVSKVVQMFSDFWAILKNIPFLIKTALATFWKIWATFISAFGLTVWTRLPTYLDTMHCRFCYFTQNNLEFNKRIIEIISPRSSCNEWTTNDERRTSPLKILKISIFHFGKVFLKLCWTFKNPSINILRFSCQFLLDPPSRPKKIFKDLIPQHPTNLVRPP